MRVEDAVRANELFREVNLPFKKLLEPKATGVTVVLKILFKFSN